MHTTFTRMHLRMHNYSDHHRAPLSVDIMKHNRITIYSVLQRVTQLTGTFLYFSFSPFLFLHSSFRSHLFSIFYLSHFLNPNNWFEYGERVQVISTMPCLCQHAALHITQLFQDCDWTARACRFSKTCRPTSRLSQLISLSGMYAAVFMSV